MRRKHNPYVALLALLLLAFIVTWICNGCAVETEAATEKTVDRFIVEYFGDGIEIITDNQTGDQYLAYRIYHTGIGLTKLETQP